MATYDVFRVIERDDGEHQALEPLGTFTEGPNDKVPSLGGYLMSLKHETGFEHVANMSNTQPKTAIPGARL